MRHALLAALVLAFPLLGLPGTAMAQGNPAYKFEYAIKGPDGRIGAVAGTEWMWDNRPACTRPGSPCYRMNACGAEVWGPKAKFDKMFAWMKKGRKYVIGVRRIGGKRFCTMNHK